MKSVLLSTFILLGVLCLQAEPDAVIPLWEGPAPGVTEDAPEEEALGGNRVRYVSVPTLDAYFPDPAVSNHKAIVVFSGGAYAVLASGPLGQSAADIFVPEGYTVFSLKYRTWSAGKTTAEDALQDAERAIRLIRSQASEWHLDPDQILVMGFSAGAHLAINLSLNANSGERSGDALEAYSGKPNWIALGSPWPYRWRIDDFEANPDVPPAFIVHAKDDTVAKYAFAQKLEEEWRRNEVPVTFVSYESGGHQAFDLRKWGSPSNDWLEQLKQWMAVNGMGPSVDLPPSP
ncbi:MAG: alpha/beta hydrolase [Puniceicoccales bacterium]